MKKRFFRYIFVFLFLGIQGCQTSVDYKTDFDVKESSSSLSPILIRPEQILMPDIKWDELYIHQAPITGDSDNPYSEYVYSVMQGTIPGEEPISVLVTHDIYRYTDEINSLKYISDLKTKAINAILSKRKSSDVELMFENKEMMASCSTNKGEVCLIVLEYPKLISIVTLGFSKQQDDNVIKNVLSKLAEKVNRDITNLIQ